MMYRNGLSNLLALVLLALLTACGSDNTSTSTLSGTAATGKGIAGTIIVKDANGTQVNVATPDGSYSVQVPNMTPPFIIKAIPDDGSATQYGFASAAGQTANVTPLSTLALFLAGNNQDLDTMFSGWDGTAFTRQDIQNRQIIVNANLDSELAAAGLDPKTYDFMTEPFKADGSAFDSVLDKIQLAIDMNAGTIRTFTIADNTAFQFNTAIDTTAYSIGQANGQSSGGNTGGSGSGSSGGGSGNSTDSGSNLPAGLAAQTLTMAFCCAAPGAPFNNGDQVEFTISSSGALTVASNLISTSFTLRGTEIVWTDDTAGLEYGLSVFNDAIHEVNVTGIGGVPFYGQFSPVP